MEERYSGDERLKALSKTNISSTALGLVIQMGYDSIKEMTKKGSYEVLCPQVDLWFQRCPKLKEASIHWVEDAYSDGTELTNKTLKRKLLKKATFHDLCGILVRAGFDCYNSIPGFLKALFGAIRKEKQAYYCATHNIDTLCDNYFQEIKEYMAYIEE